MPFSEAGITNLQVSQRMGEIEIWWDSTLPDGTIYQVYLGGVQVATTTNLDIALPAPIGVAEVRVGAVGVSEASIDFSSSLPAPITSAPAVTLVWQGGLYLAPDLAGFRVYEVVAGVINRAAPLADLPVLPNQGGAGYGGAGQGRAGQSATRYSWTSAPLPTGRHVFAVASYDAAGNEDQSPPTTTRDVVATPSEVPPDGQGRRLRATLGPGRIPTLTWQPSRG